MTYFFRLCYRKKKKKEVVEYNAMDYLTSYKKLLSLVEVYRERMTLELHLVTLVLLGRDIVFRPLQSSVSLHERLQRSSYSLQTVEIRELGLYALVNVLEHRVSRAVLKQFQKGRIQ